MIGQKNLLKRINSFSLDTFPHSVLLIGDRGSEKLDICEYISNRFGIEMYDITDSISDDYINDIYAMPSFGLYVINCDSITEREQNILLKVYEEPNQYMYIILMCETKNSILETIQTRSYELYMNQYLRSELSPLCNEESRDIILQVATTPGTVEELNHIDVFPLKTMCFNIVKKLNVTSYQNTLTITNKINFSDDYEKYPLWAFIKMLEVVTLEERSNLYFIVNEFDNTYKPLLDKKRYFENMLTNLWIASRG